MLQDRFKSSNSFMASCRNTAFQAALPQGLEDRSYVCLACFQSSLALADITINQNFLSAKLFQDVERRSYNSRITMYIRDDAIGGCGGHGVCLLCFFTVTSPK